MSGRLSPLLLAGTAGLTAAVALVVVAATGGLDIVVEPGLPDPGDLTRAGIPVVQAVRDCAMAVTVGCLAVALVCVPGQAGTSKEDRLRGGRARLVALAALAAVAWSGANVVLAALVYSDASGEAVGTAGFAQSASFFARSFPLGQYLLWGAALAAVVAVLCLRLRTTRGLGVTTLIAIAGLWPAALAGHAAGTLDHDEAVTLQMAHLLGISLWWGGLAGLVACRRRLGADLAPTVRRYSALAGVSLVLVASSGVLGALLRVPRPADLASSYGVLLGLKTSLLIGLAAAGWWQRRRLLPRIADESGAFARLAAGEVVVLATAAGLGVALGRTPPPPPPGAAEPLTAAESLIGRELPGPLDAGAWFTSWDLDSFWFPVSVLALALYLLGVRRLRRRGDRWSWLRVTAWCLGWLLMIWATSGAPGAYGRVLFSMHMVQHMTIATAVPTFLVLGSPVALALRALRRRSDGSLGPRELLQRVIASLPVQIFGHPLVAGASFVISMVAFYYSSAFAASLESHTAHLLMTAHFLLSGYLFAEVIVGDDPGVLRPPYPLRALMVMVVFGFHALFAVSLMASTRVLAEDWFVALGRPWGRSPLADQELGAGIGWVLGEYPLAVMAAALLVSWVRADQRERRRTDRRADRDGGRELADYNAWLERLSTQPARASSPTMGPRRSPAPAGEATSEAAPQSAEQPPHHPHQETRP